jgi:Kef-type K+ transport system membrane component KefB
MVPMTQLSLDNLLIVAAVAVVAPLLLGLVPGLRVPSPVLEILAGTVLGPAVLGVLTVDLPVRVVSLIGLGFLLFLAGLEIDISRLRGRALRTATVGYLATLAIGLAVGLGAKAVGWVDSPTLLAVALSATSLGLVVPTLKDAGRSGGATGQAVIAAATVADFAAILLLSLVFSTSTTGPALRIALLAGFVLAIAGTVAVLLLAGRSMRLGDLLTRQQDTTAEIRVRLAVVLLVGFAVLAEHVGLETILGAFVAGALMAGLDRDSASHPHLRTKLEAIGYGFLVPAFFVASGAGLDVRGLVQDPGALLRVPVFVVAILLVRGVPAFLPGSRGDLRTTAASALLQATTLPFVVTATQIGVASGRLSAVTGTALVCAGLVTVLLFPAGALSLLRERTPAQPDHPSELRV